MPKCSAHSSRTGNPCGRNAIAGGTVCKTHGGSSPQVQRKAAERLEEARQEMLEMLNPALARLRELLSAESESVQLAAVKDLLDRIGLGATKKSEATVTVHDGDSDLDREIARLMERLGTTGQSGTAVAPDSTSEPARP